MLSHCSPPVLRDCLYSSPLVQSLEVSIKASLAVVYRHALLLTIIMYHQHTIFCPHSVTVHAFLIPVYRVVLYYYAL